MISAPPPRFSSHGFTLVELAITLVIIGLLVGGVLLGKDLIEMSQARRVMSQMEQIQAAITTFKLKYNCLPGDCAQPASLGLGNYGGNGDGFVGVVTIPSPPNLNGGFLAPSDSQDSFTTKSVSSHGVPWVILRAYGEIQLFWVHLSAAGLIPFKLTTLAYSDVDVYSTLDQYMPRDALGKYFLMLVPWNNKLYLRTGFSFINVSTRPQFTQPLLTSAQMNYIASKFNYAPIIGEDANGYPNAFTQGQKVIPLGVDDGSTTGQQGRPYITPTTALSATKFTPCVVGTAYNPSGNGACNLLWEIAY